MTLVPKKITEKNSDWKRDVLLPFFQKNEKVLDYGCGDLTLAKSLKDKIPTLKISGVDVVGFPDTPKNIPLVVYDGKKLPFKSDTFDTVLAFYVFHHCESAEEAFRECMRVSKKRVLIIESLPRNTVELPFMKFMDWIYNVIKSESISLTYQFKSLEEWRKIFKKNGVSLKKKKTIKPPTFPILAVGEQCVMEVVK